MNVVTSIFLIGPMGSRKSAVGRRLARELGREFIDSDDAIEERSGVDIPFIFEREGEAGFRQRESRVIDVLTRLMAVRDPQFREIAHLVVETDGRKVPSVVREIRRNMP